MALRPDDLHLPVVVCRLVGVPPHKVYYDHYSHHSGRLRCTAVCKARDACRLDIFVEDYGTREHAAAVCFAWMLSGADLVDKAHGRIHMARKPTVDQVDAAYIEQFSH